MSKVELDAQSRKVRHPTRPPPAAPSRARFQTATPPPPQAVLVALLRAISQMKPILDAGDRGHLKDLVLASRMQAKVLSLGIQLAILDHDTQFDSPEADEANLDKRRSILTQLIGLLRGGDGPGGDGREDGDDYESDFEEDDMMMPDGDAVADRAGQESEIPNFKASYLGRFPLVSADFWTSDHLSERYRSVNAFPGTRARGTLTLKRR